MKFNVSKSEQRLGGIYIIKSLKTNDTYIGATKNFLNRFYRHRAGLKYNQLPLLSDYVKTHGVDSLVMEVIELVDDFSKLKTKEDSAILIMSPTMNVNGTIRNIHTEKTKVKISASMPKRSVTQFEKSGEFIERFIGIRDASRKTGISNSDIVKVCKGKIKSAGGYYWQYSSI